MNDGWSEDPTLILGMHGIFEQHPWLGRVSAEYDLDEDVFSLAVKRAAAYGWSSTRFSGGSELGGQRWGHNDAGGDWTQDGNVRQLAWLQVSVAEDLREQRLPVLPMATVLSDSLRRTGVFRLTGLHVLVPVRLAPDSRFDLAAAADWLGLADPDGRAEMVVTVSARESGGLSGRVSEIRDLARERTFGRMTVEATPAGPVGQEGLALPLAGELQTGAMRQTMAYRCRTREWSLEAAVWTTEIFIDALRAAGAGHPALITVSASATSP
ncbi:MULTISPECIES: hypothetical protein [unclassified Streptomyces]|uniref:hypothetical protein n=1 Tax=unclassified Streptomyces TaxID=2593676 RepID=UPI00096093DD|nr:hypothetical protein [Streptomyces sp. TSRI0281]OKI34861.1 hypothetical protein A6A29_15565 [Streptomyces sp. TSRI0281]